MLLVALTATLVVLCRQDARAEQADANTILGKTGRIDLGEKLTCFHVRAR
jgi:hypothetical protein